MNLEILKKALFIRKFEQKLLDLFSQGKLNGTVHTCVGQELTPVVVDEYLIEEDMIFSNHRGHGHFLSHCGREIDLMKEILGRRDGISCGIGGSQHLRVSNFISNGIQGGLAPLAAGHAFDSERGISVCYVGDGTLGEGQFYEAINLASVFACGVIYIVENNGYAQSTKTCHVNKGSLKSRFEGFGLDYFEADIWDLESLRSTVEVAVKTARLGKPVVLEVACYRLNSHSKGDDNRDAAEIAAYVKKDLINKFAKDSALVFERLEQDVDQKIEELLQVITVDVEPDFQWHLPENVHFQESNCHSYNVGLNANIRMNELINGGLRELITKGAYLIGEDIIDDTPDTPLIYGGAFKVTKGLSTAFPNKVFNTPISEAGIVGFGIGIALSGRQAIVEIMFGDFLTLAFDQILQQASKIKYMFGQEIKLPLIIRTPMGARRGYGPTHSQNIEKHFLFIPGVNCIALNCLSRPGDIYEEIGKQSDLFLVIEDKVSYTKTLARTLTEGYTVTETEDCFPIYKVAPKTVASNLVIFVYGAMFDEVLNIIGDLLFEDIIPVVICPTLLSPINLHQLKIELSKSNKLLFIEEGSKRTSLSSEVIASLVEHGIDFNLVGRISNEDLIPCDKRREEILIPSSLNLVDKILEMVNDD